MDFFHDLGGGILERWERAHFDARRFADVAAEALRARPPCEHVKPMDVVRWVHTSPILTQQSDVDGRFGQPPITVYRSDRFFIDVLFWVDGTTAIHQHRFSGAFHVLAGSSVHTTYGFARKERHSERLLSGDLEPADVELLRAGDVRPIRAGAEFVHALFHLDRPSVSVVVRTPPDPAAGPQYCYTRAGLAFDPWFTTEATKKRLQTLELLAELGSSELEPLALRAVREGDPSLAVAVMERARAWLAPRERYLAFLDGARAVHPRLVDAMALYADQLEREARLFQARRRVQQPDLRLFLGLLLNVPRRAPLLELVRRIHPERAPAETIVRWLGEIARLDAIDEWVADVAKAPRDGRLLDVRLDEAALRIAGRLLEGATDVDAIAAEPDGADRCSALRRSLVLGSLFV